MQRKGSFVSVVGLLAFVMLGVTYLVTAEESQAKAKPGESVVKYDDPSYAEQGPVEFSHPGHKEAFGKEKLDCKPCHMSKPPLFSMKPRKPGEKREVMKMEDMAKGGTCGKCHDGKTTVNDKVVFSVASEENCVRCHKK